MSNSEHCGICKPTDVETRLVQDSLCDQMRALRQKMKIEDDANDEYTHETMGFQKLIKIIFHKKFKNFKIHTQCKHHDLRKQFANRLKCSFRVLDILSDRVSCITAKYSFHVDVISSQVKTFPRHFIHEKSIASSKFQKDIQKDEKKSSEKKNEKVSLPPTHNLPQTHKKEDQSLPINPIVINPCLNSMMLPQFQVPYNLNWTISMPSPQNDNQKQQ